MTIRKRSWKNKNGKQSHSYQVIIPIGNGKYKKKSCKTRLEAQRVENELRNNVFSGYDIANGNANKSFQYYFDLYMESNKSNWSNATYEVRKNLYSTIVKPFFGEIKIKNITKKQIIEYCKIRNSITGKELNGNTLRQAFQIVMSVLDQAENDGACSYNIARNTKSKSRARLFPAVDDTYKKDPLSFEQIISISNWISQKSHNIAIMFKLMFLTALRIGEACALESRDFDFETKTFRVSRTVSSAGGWHEKNTKTGDIRILSIPGVLENDLLNLLKVSSPNEKIFKNSFGNPIRPNALRKTFIYPAMKSLGIPAGWADGYVPHDTRHAAISHSFNLGVNNLDVSAMAGHSNLSTTLKVYAHRLNQGVVQGVDKINNAFEKAEESLSSNKKLGIEFKIEFNLDKELNESGTKVEQIQKANSQGDKFVGKMPKNKSIDTYQSYK